MRTLKRNKQRMWYSLPLGKEPIVDEDGNETGEYENIYTDKVGFKAYVGSQLTDALSRAWGSDVSNNYAVMVISKTEKDDNGELLNFPNGTLIWRSKTLPDGGADYIIDGVMDEELNESSYYLRKQK